MSALYQNAVSSIRMGVEDYANNDANRTLSAVRNFYAGLLLLAKEVLVRSAPDADITEIIGAKYKPVPDGDGGVKYVSDGVQTVDFHSLSQRLKDFGLSINSRELNELNRIRNEIEHRYTDQPSEAVREAIAKAFPLTSELFRFLNEDPSIELGPAWQSMLSTKALYDRELAACRESRSGIEWLSPTVGIAKLQCTNCASELVQQVDATNTDQNTAELKCRACGSLLETEDLVVETLAEELAHESFVRAKDSGEDGPVYDCPECLREAYVDFEEMCAVCGYKADDRGCSRCGEVIPLSEMAYSDGSGLCSYCEHVSYKLMRD